MPTTNQNDPNANQHAHTSDGKTRRPDATTPPQDLYEVLGVARDASPEEISAAYKKLAKAHHPDRHSTKTEAEQSRHAEIFKQVTDAASILTDEEKRRAYDAFGRSGVSGGPSMDDARAQAMFEAMFMGGAGAGSPKKRRFLGGALFVDPSRGQFFQRSWDDVEKMKDEMKQGLPELVQSGDGEAEYVTTTAMPHGAWEVRLVEVDAEAHTVSVTLCADDVKDADGEAAPLRVERTFTLPADADVDAADVTLDEAGVLSVTTPTKCELPMDASVDSPVSDATKSEHLGDATTDDGTAIPMFVVGEDPTAAAASSPKASRAARRRAKKSGLKKGFLNAKENHVGHKAHGTAESRRASRSPISVRDGIDDMMLRRGGVMEDELCGS